MRTYYITEQFVYASLEDSTAIMLPGNMLRFNADVFANAHYRNPGVDNLLGMKVKDNVITVIHCETPSIAF